MEMISKISKEIFQEHLGSEFKYKCEPTKEPSYFHTLIFDKCYVYVEEWIEDPYSIVVVVFYEDMKGSSFEDTDVTKTILKIKAYIDFCKI